MSAAHQADRIDQAIAGTLQAQPFETVTGGELSAANLASAVNHLRDEIGMEPKQIRRLLTNEPISREDRDWVVRYERDLKTNAEFVAKYLAGDAAAVREMRTIAVHKIRKQCGCTTSRCDTGERVNIARRLCRSPMEWQTL